MSTPTSESTTSQAHDTLAKYFGEQEKQFRDAANKLRDRADTSAKTLILLGTTVLTAAGIAEFGDIFPLSSSEGWRNLLAIAGLFVSFSVIVGALGFFTARLWNVNRTVVMGLDTGGMVEAKEIDGEEKKVVDRIYKESAEAHGRGLSFKDYAQSAYSSVESSPGVDKKKQEYAETIVAEVGAVQARAAHAVIRGRARASVAGFWAVGVYALLAAAVLGYAVAADWLENERTSEVAVAKACAEAREAGANVASISICSQYPPAAGNSAKSSPAALVASQIAPLQAQLEACRKAEGASVSPGQQQCAALEAAQQSLLRSLQPIP